MATIDIAKYPEFANCQPIELAYAAGFFDGEGHIRIYNHKSEDRFILSTEVTQATPTIIEWFKEKFGGRINYREYGQSYDKTVIVRKWTWVCNSTRSALFLMKIRPYLSVKAEQADIGIAFQATMIDRAAFKYTAPEMVALRQAYHDQIRKVRKDALSCHP